MATQLTASEDQADRSRMVEVIDDDDSFRTAVVRLLRASGLTAVGHRCSGEYLLANHVDCTSCIILDMCMPGPSGLELLDSLATRPSSPPVVFVTGFGDIPATVRVFKAGAVDFLTKPIGRERLLGAVERALSLDAQRRMVRRELDELRECYFQLNTFERDIFAGIVVGRLNKQLAATLGICERSIKFHRARVMRKMHASSVADLVRSAKLLEIDAATAMRSDPCIS